MRQIFSKLLFLSLSLLLAIGLAAPDATAQIAVPSASPSQQTPSLPDPLTTETANALISRLSDNEVRALLLNQLHTQAAEVETSNDNALSELFYHATTGALEAVTDPISKTPLMIEAQSRAFTTFYQRMGGGLGLLKLLAYMALVFAIAAGAELLFRRATSGWRILPPADAENMTLKETFQLLGQRFATQVVAVVIFMLMVRFVGTIILPEVYFPVVRLIGVYLIGFPRLMLAVAFFFFAPQNPEYRLLTVDTKGAKAFCFHQFWFSFLLGFTGAIMIFNADNGVPAQESHLFFWLGLAINIYLICYIWKYRSTAVSMMRGNDPYITPTEDKVARAYPYFAIAAIIGMWWIINIIISYKSFGLLASAPQYKTLVLLMFAPAMDTAIRGAVRHLVPAMTGEGPIAERAYHSNKRAYIRIGRVIVFGLVIITLTKIWGMTPTSIASAGIGERLASNSMEFLFIISFGYLLYEAVSLYVNRQLAAEYTAAGYDPDNAEFGGDGGGAGGSRLSTVLPLILLVARSAIVVLFLLLGLSNIGVDTTPLLAGAGIVGLAIGFGAQKLVSDIVSGIFFLVDDAFRTGEYVEVEGTMGTVEKISIRSMQLRHHKGPVHTLPYGEIPKITNFSRDWVIMKLRFVVSFDTDPNKVKKIFKKIGQEMLEIEDFKDDFLAPFKSQGVLEIDDVGMVIRGKFMCKPGTQFMIRKEIFNRVNAAFAENGVEFARREVRVALPSGAKEQELTEEDKAAIAAAATQAAQDQIAGDNGDKR